VSSFEAALHLNKQGPESRRDRPEQSDPAALHGLPGEVVRTLEPHSEADPIALLAHFLVMFGNAVGRGPHVRVGGGTGTLRMSSPYLSEPPRRVGREPRSQTYDSCSAWPIQSGAVVASAAAFQAAKA
jgi:hypothetical protein